MPEISQDQLDTIFSALKPETRKMVITEVHKAMLDTSVEYHRNIDITAQKLYEEVMGLRAGLDSLKRVDEEYDDITKQNNPIDGNPPEG